MIYDDIYHIKLHICSFSPPDTELVCKVENVQTFTATSEPGKWIGHITIGGVGKGI